MEPMSPLYFWAIVLLVPAAFLFIPLIIERMMKRLLRRAEESRKKEQNPLPAAGATTGSATAIVIPIPIPTQDNGTGNITIDYSVSVDNGTSTISDTTNAPGSLGFTDNLPDPSTPDATPLVEELSLLARVADLESEDKTKAALREIYRYFNDAFKAGEFGKCDAILRDCDVEKFGVSVLIGFLTASLPAGPRLPSRAPLFYRVRDEFQRRGRTEEGLLSGLEPKRKGRWDNLA